MSPKTRRRLIAAVSSVLLCLALAAAVYLRRDAFTYTNLVSAGDRQRLASLLEDAGAQREDVDRLLELIDRFYSAPYDGVTGGWHRGLAGHFSYPDGPAAAHLDLQPDGNVVCRAAAFLIMGDKISVSPDAAAPEEKDPRSRLLLPDGGSRRRYDVLFANLSTPVASSRELAEAVSVYWQSADVTFPEGEMRLVTVYGSTGGLIQNFHTALSIYTGGEVWLFEKYDPIYPYQLSKFTSRDQMLRYLRLRADVKYAAIFENGECIWTS